MTDDIEYQERAAIMEIDGCLSPREAEHRARLCIQQEREPQPGLFKQGLNHG